MLDAKSLLEDVGDFIQEERIGEFILRWWVTVEPNRIEFEYTPVNPQDPAVRRRLDEVRRSADLWKKGKGDYPVAKI